MSVRPATKLIDGSSRTPDTLARTAIPDGLTTASTHYMTSVIVCQTVKGGTFEGTGRMCHRNHCFISLLVVVDGKRSPGRVVAASFSHD